ncbi:T6SS immunity protein Tli4 family protein [Pseudomonas saudimassiliensis]|uniref:T6SS immunity protein Tli4 family protein n=1 Tax=Pseudomonas saudimassiliensis TaxID=1461581 RepID=UPI001EF74F05|nr:T6SS immunity protein Tli4 family protein [Pseudomonas saudimassiliensis]
MIKPILACLLCLPLGVVFAGTSRQECLGRLTFDVPEEMEWATYDAARAFKISAGGGHNFTSQVTAKGDLTVYDFHDTMVYVSDIVDRSEFEAAAGYQKGTGMRYQKHLRERIETNKGRLAELPEMGYGPEVIAKLEQSIKDLEDQASRAVPIQHDLGIPDAYFLGGQSYPTTGYLYRNQRVYFFAMNKPDKHSAERFKDVVSRFRPRDLYEVPEGPGICFPYGFIADDGKTAYAIKNSLRFTSTPNVIFTLVAASANDPWQTQPTMGTYDTDYRPGYDGTKWKLTRFIEPSYIGDRLAGLEGWRLDPKPDSGEQERAWFALAHTGGLLNPLIAVQIFTFQKGVDNLTDFTPPPEDVLPRWKALSGSIRVTLDK